MCEIKASKIFKRNKELGYKSKRNVLQMIKDFFDEMAATRAVREEVASTIASARAQAATMKMIWIQLMLMGMLNMRLFLKSSIRPLSDLSVHLVGFHCVLVCSVTKAPQES